jgi:hypothetical protein
MSRPIALGLTLILALAGCLQLPDDPDRLADDAREPRTGGMMSAEETRKDDATLCTGGVELTGDRRFCATRIVTVEGTLSGFSSLDVALETFNGDVRVSEGPDGRWGFVATLKGRGASAEAATAQVDAIDFTWAHEDATGHFVEVVAEHEGEAHDLEAEILLTMPRSLVMSVVAATSNGDVELAGGKTDKLALVTSNGDVLASGSAAQVSLTTSNGKIEADLTPTSDARWALTTSNGDIALAVPEGADYGYKLEGTTSNGEVDYTLRDGEKGPCPQGSEYYTPPCNHRTFETRGFDSRDVRVHATLTTSNGEIGASPR